MTDLEKLVEGWAREVGLPVSETFGPMVGACPVGDALTAICRLAMAHAAEEAAKLCEELQRGTLASQDGPADELSNVMLRQISELGCGQCAAAIREKFSLK